MAEGYTGLVFPVRRGRRLVLRRQRDQHHQRGEPTGGRPAIAEAMGAFFEDFPDLVLRMDELRSGGNQAIFLWTLEGTNSGPGGTGNFVTIAGWQNWRLSDDLLILPADGGFDAEDYERQIREGA
jgi:hypothetical protein